MTCLLFASLSIRKIKIHAHYGFLIKVHLQVEETVLSIKYFRVKGGKTAVGNIPEKEEKEEGGEGRNLIWQLSKLSIRM